MDEGDKTTGYCGLVNEGTTCYVNSLLQTLFILKAFRRAIFKMPGADPLGIPCCLQRVFYNLK